MKDEDERRLQARLLEEAVSVELAKITASSNITVDGGGWRYEGHAITAEPVRALRGERSEAALSMTDRSMTDCGLRGGGPATAEKPGAWIIVFTGVRLGQDVPYNYGIPVGLARDITLVKAANDAAAALYVESKAK